MAYGIKDFADITGLPPSSLRFYEQKGYPQAERTPGGYRNYSIGDSMQMNTFNALMAQGFNVKEAIARLTPGDALAYADALEANAQRMEQEIAQLAQRVRWNRQMRFVYSQLPRELETVRVLPMEDMVFLQCSEGFDQRVSLEDGELMTLFVSRLPVSCYAMRMRVDQPFQFGMLMPRNVLPDAYRGHARISDVPAGEYVCLLQNHDNPDCRALARDPRLAPYGGRVQTDIAYRAYLMAEVNGYSADLNYLMLRLR